MSEGPRILLGVTVDLSLSLMEGFPEYLRDRGWQVHVVSSPGPRLERLGHERGITVHAVSMERAPRPFADLRSLFRWIRVVRMVRPRVVSVGTPKAALLGAVAAWLTRVPVRVSLLRGLRLETSTGLQRFILTWMERLTSATATDVLAVSPSLRTRAIELELVPEKKIRVLGLGSSNGVDIRAMDSAAPLDEAHRVALTEGVPVIGFVGRLAADKGLGTLADARAELVARGVDHQLLLVGGVDEDHDSAAMERLLNSGRPAVVVGQVPRAWPYFRLMDVLCLPTLREGFPNVVLEAAGSRVPTVTTDATGAIDSVVDGETGFLVPVGDASALADALATVVSDPSLARRLGSAARDRAERDFDRPLVWARTEAALRALSERAVTPR